MTEAQSERCTPNRPQLQLNIGPTPGEEMEHVVREAYALPQSIVLKVRKALSD